MQSDRMRVSRRSFVGAATAMLASAGFSRRAAAWTPQCRQGSIAASPSVLPSSSSPSLGSLASAAGLSFGVQVSAEGDLSYGTRVYDSVYQKLIAREAPRFLAAGDAFKFAQLCPDDPAGGPLKFTNAQWGVTDSWHEANDIVALTQSMGTGLRADALIQQTYSPKWLQTLPGASTRWWESSQYNYNMGYLDSFISAVMKKIIQYSAGNPGFVQYLGVVNEPLDPVNLAYGVASYAGGPFQPPGIPTTQKNSAAYIWSAFSKVQIYNQYWSNQLGLAPTAAKLYLNETGADTDQYGPLVRAGLLSVLKEMKSAGIKIDGVGLECHLQPQMMYNAYSPDWSAFGNFLQSIQDLGLEVYITELDVLDYVTSCNGSAGGPGDSDYITNLYYKTFLATALKYACVKCVTIWDLSDRYTFYRSQDESQWGGYNTIPRPKPANSWPNCPVMPASPTAIACARPDVFDDQYLAKPARAALAAAFSAAPHR